MYVTCHYVVTMGWCTAVSVQPLKIRCPCTILLHPVALIHHSPTIPTNPVPSTQHSTSEHSRILNPDMLPGKPQTNFPFPVKSFSSSIPHPDPANVAFLSLHSCIHCIAMFLLTLPNSPLMAMSSDSIYEPPKHVCISHVLAMFEYQVA